MADALISVVLQRLTAALESEIQQEARLLFGGQNEVEKLTTTLTAIRAVLNDAERKQVTESSVKVWLEELKSLSYDLDDVLDEWNTKIYRPRVEKMAKSSRPKAKKMVRFSRFLSPPFLFKQTVMRRDIGIKIKRIRERLDGVANEKDKYHFALEGRAQEPERLETTPLVDVSEVRGRDLDKDIVISKLCEGIPGENGIQEESGPLIVSIVGMGGIGKTTLAQLAFNDDRLNAHFEHKIWVCVSEPFDKARIAKMIIEAVDRLRPCIFWSELQRQLCDVFERKKFLIVLDDVWTDDFQIWDPIKVALKSGASGSRILVTTRNERVSKMMEAHYMLSLGGLSPEDSWSLFSRLAFYGKGSEDRNNLEEIGRKIADRCKGLPLAVKTLGSLMRLKETKQAWENVLDSELWELEEVERWISPPLLLSYYDLPSPMKRCFTFCAIFPKDHKIDKDTLIQHWMAQGFLVPTGSIDMEQKGVEYFDNLVMRSFFQDLERDEDDHSKITCKMHSVVHGFAQFLARNECFIMEVDKKNLPKLDTLHTKARHVTSIGRMEEFHPSVYNLRSLRTLLALQKEIRIAPSDLFRCMTSLRGLDLSHTSIIRLPREVGKLWHLRLLNLSRLALEELPDTLSNLYNLLTLNLDSCRRLQSLPGGLVELIKLRHLIIKETDSLSILPQGIGRLSNLRTLCRFVVSDDGEGCDISELKNLNDLRGHLEMSGLEKVKNVDKVREADLMNKQNLRSLDLVFSFGEKEVMENVIEALQPPPNLESLQVYDYDGSILPSWITMLSNLKDLRLLRCTSCLKLPPLGKLPSLEKLLIGHFNNLKSVGVEFLGVDPVTEKKDGTKTFFAFPKLKELTFRFMEEWENWDISHSAAASSSVSRGNSNVTVTTRRLMPYLRSLSLYDCRKLMAIPQDLQLMPLEEMIITRCPILEQQSQHQ